MFLFYEEIVQAYDVVTRKKENKNIVILMLFKKIFIGIFQRESSLDWIHST